MHQLERILLKLKLN